MMWPTPQDYNESIQSRSVAFSDSDLRASSPELTPLGLPRPISGMFASVYRMQNSTRAWAVRCFLRDLPDLQTRYSAISNHLKAVRSPYVVGFDYLQRGIQVRGQWYPILKMEWVDGVTLSRYVEGTLYTPTNLLRLAEQWVTMVSSLQKSRIAHGDLQHGNVLVVGQQLRLVDYDGMFVPDLLGLKSHEVGHRNYQHPQRTESHFSHELDNFSAWVVYLSLSALSIQPSLWHQFQGGDECLLLRQQDFLDPKNSALIQSLLSAPDSRIQEATRLFIDLLKLDPLSVPSVSELLVNTSPVTILASVTSAQNTVQVSAQWIEDYVSTGASQPIKPNDAAIVTPTAPSPQDLQPDSSWILDALFQDESAVTVVQFEGSITPERVVLKLSGLITTILLLFALVYGLIPYYILSVVILGAANGLLLIVRYMTNLSVRRRSKLAHEVSTLYRQVLNVDKQKSTTQDQIKRTEQSHTRQSEKKLAERRKIEEREKKELDIKTKDVMKTIENLQSQRRSLQVQEQREIDKLQNNTGRLIHNLSSQLQTVDRSKAEELRKALADKQRDSVTNYLRSQLIDNAFIPGIGHGIKAHLRAAGIRSAADVSRHRLQGTPHIGPARESAVMWWRQEKENEANRTVPQRLDSNELGQIEAKWDSQRRQLDNQLRTEQHKLQSELATLQNKNKSTFAQLDIDEASATQAKQRLAQEVKAQFASEYELHDKVVQELQVIQQKDIQDIRDELVRLERERFQIHWQYKRLQREEQLAFGNIHFAKFLTRIVSG
jgi:hypothetical protein